MLRGKDYRCGKVLGKDAQKESFMFWLTNWNYLITSSFSSTLLLDILIFHSDASQSLFCLMICCIQQFQLLITLSNNSFRFAVESTPKRKKHFQYKENKLLCFMLVRLRKVKDFPGQWRLPSFIVHQFVRINLLVVNLLNSKFYWPNVYHYGFKTQSQTWT